MKKSAIILAGGKGSRLGYVDKAFLTYKGQYFIDILLDKLKNFHEIIIVTNSPEKYSDYKNIKIIEDTVKNIGPIGGIFSGLQHITSDEALVLSCDIPFISISFINYLKTLDYSEEIIVSSIYGKMEPLCSLYKKSILKTMENSILNKDYKISNIFNKVKVKYIPVDKEEIIKSFYNINTPKDLEETWNFSI